MGKGKGKKDKTNKIQPAMPQNLPESHKIIEPPKPKKNKLNFLNIVLGIIASIIVIVTAIQLWTTSNKSTFNKETSISGYLKPPILNVDTSNSLLTLEGLRVFFATVKPKFHDSSVNKNPKIKGVHLLNFKPNSLFYIEFGNKLLHLNTEYFLKGVDLLKTAGIDCSNAEVILGIKDDRLYVSTEFKRLQNEETMGIIEFNRWTLYKENVLKYRDNDTMLEVRDKQNKIAFSIKFGQTTAKLNTKNGLVPLTKDNSVPGVVIRGYFIGDTSVAIINSQAMLTGKTYELNQCVSKSDPAWKKKALILISDIKSLW